ncbi:MAG: cupin domain-containing protein [Planctomycetaceae bacterium]|jgi:ethanolamine utilization protein EutQ (cupin superfamily)|nr:cupin domain-containing protein [Planctomycetaceae bacterium]
MPVLIEKPVCFQDAAVRGEEIKEFIGRISTGTELLSIGLLTFPEGWSEPPQCPEFDEYTVVLEGNLYVDTESAGTLVVHAGCGILTPRGERIQYRTPEPNGAKYVAVCFPAFTPEQTHRCQTGIELPKTDQPQWNPQSRIVMCCRPTYLQGTGHVLKQVEEYFGYLNNNSQTVSIVRVRSRQGCEEKFLNIDYDNYYIVLNGELHFYVEPQHVEHCQVEQSGEWMKAVVGQAVIVRRGENVHCVTPTPAGAEYIMVSHPPYDRDYNNFCSEDNNYIIATDKEPIPFTRFVSP